MADMVNRKRAIETSPRRRMKSRGLRARAWWIIREKKSVTLDQLLHTLNDGSQRDAESNLRRYLSALAKAGILKIGDKRKKGDALTSNGFKIYNLVVDCGREAPVVRVRLNEVYAPDLKQAYEMGGAA